MVRWYTGNLASKRIWPYMMEGEERSLILSWKQENVTSKDICKHTRRAKSSIMALLAAAGGLPPDDVLAIKSRTGCPRKILLFEEKGWITHIWQMQNSERNASRPTCGGLHQGVSSIACKRTWTFQVVVLHRSHSWLRMKKFNLHIISIGVLMTEYDEHPLLCKTASPCHKVKKVMIWFAGKKIEVLYRTGKNADLNPIGNARNMIK